MIAGLLDAVKAGGGWVACLLLMGAYLWARHRGWLLTEKDVERTIGGYVQVISHQEKELAYQRDAGAKKDETIRTQAEQNARLMSGTELSARTVEAIVKEARGRELDS